MYSSGSIKPLALASAISSCNSVRLLGVPFLRPPRCSPGFDPRGMALCYFSERSWCHHGLKDWLRWFAHEVIVPQEAGIARYAHRHSSRNSVHASIYEKAAGIAAECNTLLCDFGYRNAVFTGIDQYNPIIHVDLNGPYARLCLIHYSRRSPNNRV